MATISKSKKKSSRGKFFEFRNLKVTVHKCAETIQGRKLYEEIQYLNSKRSKKFLKLNVRFFLEKRLHCSYLPISTNFVAFSEYMNFNGWTLISSK